jgi:hypothetical protein
MVNDLITEADPSNAAYGDHLEPSGPRWTDEELTELALAADPALALDPDAVPLSEFLGHHDGLLPLWYMPSPMVRGGGRWRLPVVLVIVGAFLVIEALGLCSTFGQLVPA